MGYKILVVDDEIDFLESIKRGLTLSGYRDLHLESDPRAALQRIKDGNHFDMALLDVTLPGTSGVELLDSIKNLSPTTECIMVTAVNDTALAVSCIKKGAYDYLVKPITRDDLLLRISHALERKRLLDVLECSRREGSPPLDHVEAFQGILTQSPDFRRVLKEAELHAASNVPVLITGESGTGKELLARSVHRASPRARFPFTAINMASLTGTLFDAEFFGHTRGAFTGADRDRAGHLKQSDRGTIFFDEIGTLPLELQGKLLRVLQEGEFLKLGTSALQKVDVRFIAATNEDLEQLMRQGLFRKDLFYRLRGAWLHLPPLRERAEDLPLLIGSFIEEFTGSFGSESIDDRAMAALRHYSYPGNVRELRSILQAAVNLAQHQTIRVEHLPQHLPRRPHPAPFPAAMPTTRTLAEVERAHILEVYHRNAGNKMQTAKLLGIGLNTLRRKLESYGFE